MERKPTDDKKERIEGPKPDEAVTGDKAKKPDVTVPKGGESGGADPREIGEGEATRGGYG